MPYIASASLILVGVVLGGFLVTALFSSKCSNCARLEADNAALRERNRELVDKFHQHQSLFKVK